MLPTSFRPLFVATLCIALSACGPQVAVDLGSRANVSSSIPRINNVEFVGPSRLASQVLVFELDFDDDDGDLDKGELVITLVSKERNVSTLKLKPLFLMNEVAPNAKKGRIRFPLEVDFVDPGNNPGQAKFEVWLQLKDALGHTSNVAKIRLLANLT